MDREGLKNLKNFLPYAADKVNIQPLNNGLSFMQSSKARLHVLDQIKSQPSTTQATLAERLGVAVGTIIWFISFLNLQKKILP